jgi:flagellar basal-body rod protein FlgC
MKVGYLNGMNNSSGALSAYRQWMDTVSENLANAQTTRTAEGGPYQRKQISFEEVQNKNRVSAGQAGSAAAEMIRTHSGHQSGGALEPSRMITTSGVKANVQTDTTTPFTRVYDPAHPDAGQDGFVEYPNINPVTEMVNLIMASRAYEANIAALAAEKRMAEMSLSIGKI